MTLILVPGTLGGRNDWTAKGSPLRNYLAGQGFACEQFQGFTGNVDGVPNPLENGAHADWIAGGYALNYMLMCRPYEERNIVAHSHGGNVAAYAAGRAGLKVRSLITVCTPVRKDMLKIYADAKPAIGWWRHVYADGWDLWQRLGEAFDGSIGWKRDMPNADQNVGIKGISHATLLEDPKRFPLFLKQVDLCRV